MVVNLSDLRGRSSDTQHLLLLISKSW